MESKHSSKEPICVSCAHVPKLVALESAEVETPLRCDNCGASLAEQNIAKALINHLADGRYVSLTSLENHLKKSRPDFSSLEIVNGSSSFASFTRMDGAKVARCWNLDRPSTKSSILAEYIENNSEIKLSDESQDLVICRDTLNFVDDDAKLVRELFRVLKWSGIAIVSVPIAWPFPQDTETFEQLSSASMKRRKRRYGLDIIELFRSVGFSVVFKRPAFLTAQGRRMPIIEVIKLPMAPPPYKLDVELLQKSVRA